MRLFILLSFVLHPAVTTSFDCGCKWDQIWNDVVYLIDNSAISGPTGVQEIWGAVQSMSQVYNVQRTDYTASNYSMRLGIVSYNANVSVVDPLGSVDNGDLSVDSQFPYVGGSEANLALGIIAAAQQFTSPSHRPNSRKVIIILAFGDDNQSEGAINAAQIFKESGEQIIVEQFVGANNTPSKLLQQIANPGYYFSTAINSEVDVQNANCDANCFCPINYVSYSNSDRYTPQDGCYSAGSVRTSYSLASKMCTLVNNGYVAFTETPDKAQFVSKLFPQPDQFYIGAVFDIIDQAWEWADGTPVGNSSNWINGQTPSGTNGQSCVYISASTLQWVATDCRNGYWYACEAVPCSSLFYCA